MNGIESIELVGGIIDGNIVAIPDYDKYWGKKLHYEVSDPYGTTYRYSRTDRKTKEGLTIFEFSSKIVNPTPLV